MLTVLMAQADSNEPYMILLNYGILGLLVVLVLTGQLRTKAEVERLEVQNQEYRDIIKAFQMQLTTQTLPAMSRSAQVLEAIPDKETAMFEELRNTQNETQKLLKRLEKLAGSR